MRQSFDSGYSRQESKPLNAAAKAATTIRRILTADDRDSNNGRLSLDPLEDQGERIRNRKSHSFLLLKPQIVLHCEEGEDSFVYLAALEASLQIHTILDIDHVDDPVNGYIMAR